MYFDVKVYNLGANSVTRAFFEIVKFFSENRGKKCGKSQKVVIYAIKYNLLDSYNKYFGSNFQNFLNCGNSGHTSWRVSWCF